MFSLHSDSEWLKENTNSKSTFRRSTIEVSPKLVDPTADGDAALK